MPDDFVIPCRLILRAVCRMCMQPPFKEFGDTHKSKAPSMRFSASDLSDAFVAAGQPGKLFHRPAAVEDSSCLQDLLCSSIDRWIVLPHHQATDHVQGRQASTLQIVMGESVVGPSRVFILLHRAPNRFRSCTLCISFGTIGVPGNCGDIAKGLPRLWLYKGTRLVCKHLH